MRYAVCATWILFSCAATNGPVVPDGREAGDIGFVARPWEPAAPDSVRGLLPHLTRCGVHPGDRVTIGARVDARGALSNVAVTLPAGHEAEKGCVSEAVHAGVMELEPEHDHWITWVAGQKPERWRSASPDAAGAHAAEAADSNIHAAMSARLTTVRACYERQQREDRYLRGGFTLRFTIGKNGRVVRAAVEDVTPGMGPVAYCAQNAVRTFAFGVTPREEIEVKYPLSFAPSSDYALVP